MFNAKYGLCIYSFELVYQHDIYIYIYIFIIQYSLVGGFNPSEKKTTLSQLGLSFPKYGVTVIQTTS